MKWELITVDVACPGCGNDFEMPPYHVRENRRRAIKAGLGDAWYCGDCLEEIEHENQMLDEQREERSREV